MIELNGDAMTVAIDTYERVVFGDDCPQFIFASRPVATKWLYESDLLEQWLPVLVPSGPGFSCL